MYISVSKRGEKKGEEKEKKEENEEETKKKRELGKRHKVLRVTNRESAPLW